VDEIKQHQEGKRLLGQEEEKGGEACAAERGTADK